VDSRTKYPFLSEKWIEEAKKIRAEYEGQAPRDSQPIRMNHIVVDVPFGEGTVKTHLDTTSGYLDLDLGHLDSPDLTITMDYETARAILVDRNPQTGIQAFMAGKIRVEGDMTKLMMLQNTAMSTNPLLAEIAARIQAITE